MSLPSSTLTRLQALKALLVHLVGRPCHIAHDQVPSDRHIKLAEMVVPTQLSYLFCLVRAEDNFVGEEGLEGAVVLGSVQEVVDQRPGVIGEQGGAVVHSPWEDGQQTWGAQI